MSNLNEKKVIKVKSKNEAPTTEQPPMADASSSLPPQEPGMSAGLPPMPSEPMGNEPPVDGGDLGDGEPTGKVKEIMDTANEISEKDQDTLLAYARSLKDASEEATEPNSEMPPQDPGMGGQPPMMESVVFTKKQIKKLNENFGEMNQELEREKELGHSTKPKTDKNKPVSPFDPPRKNRR